MWSVRGMREGGESSATGFQEETGRQRRRGGSCECKNDNLKEKMDDTRRRRRSATE